MKTGGNDLDLSVVIPVYNAERYIERCIGSILLQKMDSMEIICINDGSSDNSLNILQGYEKKFSNFRVYTQNNSYAGAARNKGLLQAKGKYIHFMDADDYLFPDSYRKVFELAEKFEADYIKTRNQAFDIDTKKPLKNHFYSLDTIDEKLFEKKLRLQDAPEEFLGITYTPWSGWYRRKFLLEKGIWFNRLICVNDRSFYIQALAAAETVALGNIYMVYHQVNGANSLVGIRDKNFSCHFQSWEIIYEAVKYMAPDLRKKIMGAELEDMAYWFSRLNEESKKENHKKLRALFNELSLENEIDESFLASQLIKDLYLAAVRPKLQLIQEWNKEVISKIRKENKEVIVYGAGWVGRKMMKYLMAQNVRVSHVAVSKPKDNPEEILGKRVKGIGEIMQEPDVDERNFIIIVAVSERYQLTIFEILRRYFHGQIYYVSGRLAESLAAREAI